MKARIDAREIESEEVLVERNEVEMVFEDLFNVSRAVGFNYEVGEVVKILGLDLLRKIKEDMTVEVFFEIFGEFGDIFFSGLDKVDSSNSLKRIARRVDVEVEGDILVSQVSFLERIYNI